MTKIAISQSNYIPWKGYFDIINSVDLFVIYDDSQYTRRDWRNRNLIKTAKGLSWLTIPIKTKGNYEQKISEMQIADPTWRKTHWERVKQQYKKTPYFEYYYHTFEDVYLKQTELNLSAVNYNFILLINRILGINTEISWSREYELHGNKTEKLMGICRQVGASEYVSGPAGKSYIDLDIAKKSGVNITWQDYSNYPEYRQLFPPFEHRVSVIDLILNEGPNAHKFMKSFT